jgi:beta-lactamase regulating signal transducer with metallopeptidase domain/photosystem II stability/assembly factor-like uncharacterized protein
MHAFWEIVASNCLLVTALAMTVTLLGRLWRNPARLHLLWVLVLVKLLTPPMVSVPVHLPVKAAVRDVQPVDAVSGVPSQSHDSIPIESTISPVLTRQDYRLLDHVAILRHAPDTGAVPSAAGWWPTSWLTLLGLTWGIGTVAIAMVRACRILCFLRLLKSAHAPSAALISIAVRVSQELGLKRVPTIQMLSVRISPLVWSLGGRPQVLLPTELFEQLDAAARTDILTHELAHVRRKDHWVRLFELLVTTLFWWHPVVWWACRELRQLEEQCCDAMVVGMAPDRARDYAAALLDTLDFVCEGAVAAPLGAAATRSSTFLAKRIVLLKNRTSIDPLGLGRLLLVAVVAALPMSVAFPASSPETTQRKAYPATSIPPNARRAAALSADEPCWQPIGWGGGGYYFCCAFHPTKPGVIYMGGDVAGAYKSEDHGKHWRMINRGLTDYGVYSLAVDKKHPDTVYAGTLGGICRSADAGEHWTFLEETGKEKQEIMAVRKKSVRMLAVDSSSGTVYAGTPTGQIFRSDDGGQTWLKLYQLAGEGSIGYVAVAEADPKLVLAATTTEGLIKSEDGGATWTKLATPAEASCVAIAPSDPNFLYAGFAKDGVYRSADRGKSWAPINEGLQEGAAVLEIVVDARSPETLYCIANDGWNGHFHASTDGGRRWSSQRMLMRDLKADPTMPGGFPWLPKNTCPMSVLTNIAISPANPKELFMSANWRPVFSADGGQTWQERVAGADITCVTDIQFLNGKTYVTAMDEGLLVSDDHGVSWQQVTPRTQDKDMKGHYYRVLVQQRDGVERIVTTCAAWANFINRVLLSEDSGKTFRICDEGLPKYCSALNTMHNRAGMRGLVADPTDPDTFYAGMDGDPASAPGKVGGGIFRSTDGGRSWKQLLNQPGSRRVFYGLAIDPTNPKRIFWGACGKGGGLYRSEDAGESWKLVFQEEAYVWNVVVTAAGTLYCPGVNLWRSADHGNTWQKLSNFEEGATVGLAVDPSNEKNIWVSKVYWWTEARGGVYETRDGGGTWQEITGNLPFCKPAVLRFDADTRELWAGWVGLYKIKR